MNWSSALRQADNLVRQGGSMCWQWGDLLLACTSSGRADIERLYSEVSDAPAVATLVNYRSVARAWPKEKRKQASWEAHSILRVHQEVLPDGMTGADARRSRGEKRPVVPQIASSHVTRLRMIRRSIRLAARMANDQYKEEVAEEIVGIEESLDALRDAYGIIRELVP